MSSYLEPLARFLPTVYYLLPVSGDKEDPIAPYTTLHEVDPSAFSFLRGIKNEDNRGKVSLLACFGSASAGFAVPYIRSILPSWASPFPYLLPYITGPKIAAIATKYFEKRADAAALEQATADELKGFARFLQAEHSLQDELEPLIPAEIIGKRLVFRSLYKTARTPADRLIAVNEELQKRKISTDITQGDEYLRLKNYLGTNWTAKLNAMKFTVYQ